MKLRLFLYTCLQDPGDELLMDSYWHLTTDFLLGEFWSCCIDVWTWSRFWRTCSFPPLELQPESPLRHAKTLPALRIVAKPVQRSQWASLRQCAWRSQHFRATTAFTKLLPDSLILHPAALIANYFMTCLNSSCQFDRSWNLNLGIWCLRQTLLNGVRLKILVRRCARMSKSTELLRMDVPRGDQKLSF